MTIIYNIDKNKNHIYIFGEDFVKNNKNNCYLIINGKKIKLCIDLNFSGIILSSQPSSISSL